MDVIERAQEKVGTEFLDVTIATDDHNEDLVSLESRQGIVVVNNGSTSASYVKVDETPIEDFGQDVLKLDADKEAHYQGETSENDGQRAVHNNNRVHKVPYIKLFCTRD